MVVRDLLNFCSSVIVFGSYASGQNKKNSDLDLAVFGCKDKKKVRQIKENYLIDINEHYINYFEFKGLLRKKQALSLEILGNHVLFGDVSKFVDFFNKAQPISTRMHQLELLPGVGKKHMWEILEQRKEKPFESFEDIKKRVKLMPDPEKVIIKRILLETEGKEKHKIFIG